jgi:DNA-binding transcriptional LysR family regulator
VVLIERTTRSLRLSQMGVGFLPRAQRMLTEMNNAFHEIRDASRLNDAEVGVACLKSVAHHLLPQIIMRYSQQYPGSRVRIFDGTSSEVTEAVLSRHCDVGIIVLGGPSQDIQATALTKDPFVLVCRDDNPLRARKSVRWKDLQAEPLILLNQTTASGLSFKHAINESKLVLPRLYQVQHSTTALGLVNAGLGAAILPSLNLFQGVYPRIHAIPLVDPRVEREIGAIRRQDTALAPAAQNFFDMVREVFAHRPQEGGGDTPGRPPKRPWKPGLRHATH